MDDGSRSETSSLDGLLRILNVAVIVCAVCVAGLLLKGRVWARDASQLTPLVMELQRNELALRSLLGDAYQWNQKYHSPELAELFKRLNLTVQVQPAPGSNPGTPNPSPGPNPSPNATTKNAPGR